MTPANRIEITLSDEKLAELDRARGLVPRATFVKHAVDMAVAGDLARTRSPRSEADFDAWAIRQGLDPSSPGGANAKPKGLGKGPVPARPKGGKR